MPNKLSISFPDSPNSFFAPNQVLRGIVELRINEATKARGLRLTVDGKADCEFKPKGSKDYYRDKEKFMDQVVYLFGSKTADITELPVGVRTFTFEFLLPEMLPYSAQGEHGSIKYVINANLDIPWAFDLFEEKEFMVVRHEDLNSPKHYDLKSPVEFEEQVNSGGASALLNVQLGKTGFGFGEPIPIHVEMKNNSKSKRIDATTLVLRQWEQCNVRSPLSYLIEIVKTDVVSKTSQGAEAGETVKFIDFIEVPPVVLPSSHLYSNVFQIKYELGIFVGNLKKTAHIRIPITIGAVGITN